LDQRVDSLLDRATANEFVYEDIALLPDAEGAVGRLVFDGGVPPAVEMRDMRGGGQIEARPAGLERQDEERDGLVFLELFDELLAFADGGFAMQDQSRAREFRSEQSLQRRDDLLELGEDQELFLAAGDGLGDLHEATKFAAAFGVIRAVAEPLRWVIA